MAHREMKCVNYARRKISQQARGHRKLVDERAETLLKLPLLDFATCKQPVVRQVETIQSHLIVQNTTWLRSFTGEHKLENHNAAHRRAPGHMEEQQPQAKLRINRTAPPSGPLRHKMMHAPPFRKRNPRGNIPSTNTTVLRNPKYLEPLPTRCHDSESQKPTQQQ